MNFVTSLLSSVPPVVWTSVGLPFGFIVLRSLWRTKTPNIPNFTKGAIRNHKTIRLTHETGIKTLSALFAKRCQISKQLYAFWNKENNQWVGTTWEQFYEQAGQLAQGLLDFGIKSGEVIAVLGPTKPKWYLADMAGQLIGCTTMGYYQQQTPEYLQYLMEHSETAVVFVSGKAELQNLLTATKSPNNKVRAIVVWEDEVAEQFNENPLIKKWSQMIASKPLSEEDRLRFEPDPDSTALFIYTSGTTGPPKGAMITHNNILSFLTATGGFFALNATEDALAYSFLPLSHAAEKNAGFYGRLSTGVTTVFATSAAVLLDEIKDVRPTVFGSVPRIFEKAYTKIMTTKNELRGVKRILFEWAESCARQRANLVVVKKQPIPLGLKFQLAIADFLVYKKIRSAFGGRCNMFITGAAPISFEILELMWGVGLEIYEAYGMTETTVISHLNSPGNTLLRSVGRPIPGLQHKIAEDGEILIKGPTVFKGYYKNQEATESTLVNGWMHTGDIGRIENDYLFITDRKKHLIITSGGKNLAPANIENAIKSADPLISQVHAHGDKRNYVSCLITPSPVETLEFGVKNGVIKQEEAQAEIKTLMSNPTSRTESLAKLTGIVTQHSAFKDRIKKAIFLGNAKLMHAEQIGRAVILTRDFSQEEGELTPTMKMKRAFIETKYKDIFQKIYQEPLQEGVLNFAK